MGRNMNGCVKMGNIHPGQHFSRNTGGSNRQIEDFGNSRIDRAGIFLFVAHDQIIGQYAGLLVGWPRQIGNHPGVGYRILKFYGISYGINIRIGGL